jgi:hypothetical protein
MFTQATFLKQFINEDSETIQQIEQIRLKLETIIRDKSLDSVAIEEFTTVITQIDGILTNFNSNKSDNIVVLEQKTRQLQELGSLLDDIAIKYQETYSKKLITQIKYYVKGFYGLSKRFELLSLTNQIKEPSDLQLIQMCILLGEYLNISWEVFPEDVMMYGALARGMVQEDNTTSSIPDLLLSNAVNSYKQIAQEAAQKALNSYVKRIAIKETKKILDDLIQSSNNTIQKEILLKAKNSIEELPESLQVGSVNIIKFDASTLENEEGEGNNQNNSTEAQLTKSSQHSDDWDREEQLKKNQKAIAYFKQKLENKPKMTEEEIKQSQEDFRILQEIIENSR